ncbi:MAG: magnesium/cobalt transporter CorA [Phycisphaerae bacterium]
MRFHAAEPPPSPSASTNIRVIHYDAASLVEESPASVEALRRWREAPGVTWIDVEGLDASLIRGIGELFGLHPLAIEDVLHVNQRAKVEQYASHHFIVTRIITLAEELESEQVGLFLGDRFVITFQQGAPGDCFDQLRQRLRGGGTRLRAAGPDALAYALLDAVVDAYFPVLETIGERLDLLEDAVLAAPARRAFQQVHEVKRQLFTLRRAAWPMRDALNTLVREPLPRIADETRLYLRDCYDHVLRIIDLVETYREYCADLMDLYLSSSSQRMNEIMKLLTIISTIFIPLTFISSIYGMNFDPNASRWNMPELRWRYGYLLALLVMFAIGVALLAYFWRRGWLQSSGSPSDPDEAARL